MRTVFRFPYKGKRDVNARLKLSTLFTVHSPMFHHSLFVHNEHVKLGLKRVAKGPCPTHFNSRTFFWGTKKMSENAEPRNEVQNFGLNRTWNSCRFGHRFTRPCDVAGAGRSTIISSDAVFELWNACKLVDTSFVGLCSSSSSFGQISVWQSATLLPISCKSVPPVPAWVEEPGSSVRQLLMVVPRTIQPFPRFPVPAREGSK